MTPAATLLSRLRVNGFSVRLGASGGLVIRPKKRLSEGDRVAVNEHMNDLVALLEAERRPADRDPGDTRPTLPGRVGDLAEDAGRAWAVIRGINETAPRLYRHAGRLAWVTTGDDGAASIGQLDAAGMTHFLCEHARFVVERREGDAVAETLVAPPALLVRELLATPDPPVPVVLRVIGSPTFAASGDLHEMPGYHPGTRAVYAKPQGFSMPPVAAHPTTLDVEAARSLLLEVVCNFPFVGDADRAHALAMPLAVIGRELIGGPVPFTLFDKPTQGTGATLLAQALALLATGQEAAVMAAPTTNDEVRKALTAVFLSGAPLGLFDNLTGELNFAALSAALTAATWKDRLLGESQMVRLPVRTVLLGTANNLRLGSDLSRRTVWVRLDTKLERPWLRANGGTAFQHPDLLAWIGRERGRLVHAVLTLVRAWLRAGRPAGTVTLGGYEAWAQAVGGILDVAGVPGFLGNLAQAYEADAETDDARRFLGAWWERLGDRPTKPADLFAIATGDDVDLPLAGKDDHGRRCSLGRWLERYRGRPFTVSEAWCVAVRKVPGQHRSTWSLEGAPLSPATTPAPRAQECRSPQESSIASRGQFQDLSTVETGGNGVDGGWVAQSTPATPATPARVDVDL